MSHRQACKTAVGGGGLQCCDCQQRKRGEKTTKKAKTYVWLHLFPAHTLKAPHFSNRFPAWGVREQSPQPSVGACITLPLKQSLSEIPFWGEFWRKSGLGKEHRSPSPAGILPLERGAGLDSSGRGFALEGAWSWR